jgi:hypothetical protein
MLSLATEAIDDLNLDQCISLLTNVLSQIDPRPDIALLQSRIESLLGTQSLEPKQFNLLLYNCKLRNLMLEDRLM